MKRVLEFLRGRRGAVGIAAFARRTSRALLSVLVILVVLSAAFLVYAAPEVQVAGLVRHGDAPFQVNVFPEF